MQKCSITLKIRRYLVPWGSTPSRHHRFQRSYLQFLEKPKCTTYGACVRRSKVLHINVQLLPFRPGWRLWTSLQNPKDCRHGQATKNPGPISCAMVRATTEVIWNSRPFANGDARRYRESWEAWGDSRGLALNWATAWPRVRPQTSYIFEVDT